MNNSGASQRLLYLIAKTSQDSPITEIVSLVNKTRELMSNGADPNHVNEDDGVSLLGVAIKQGLASEIKVLSEVGCDMNAPILEMHPLLFASRHRPDLTKILVEFGSGKGMKQGEIMPVLDQIKHENQGNDLVDADKIAEALFGPIKDIQEAEHILYDYTYLKNEQDREKNESRRHYIKLLAEKGPYRRYSPTPLPEVLNSLLIRFPNFEEVITYVKCQISLANLSKNAVMTLSPILLHGAPGTGKTRFIQELSQLMGMEFSKINCGAVTAGWVISGSSTSWQEGRPGFVHIAMRDGKSANPVIMLDEIDKLSGDARFNAFGSLYQLLEDSTSKEFSDEAVNIPIDCSKVSWIATANEIDLIPTAILSRMKLIEIHAPDKDQIKDTIRSIMSDILQANKDSWGSKFEEEIPENVMLLLSNYTPRDIRNMIKDAMGEAASNRKCDKYTLEQSDFVSLRKRGRGMGFM